MGSFKEAVRRAAAFCALAALGLAGCERGAPPPKAVEGETPVEKDGYLASPAVTSARLDGGNVVLEGVAQKGARVRLASPSGGEQLTQADDEGRWRIIAAPVQAPRIFGLSMTTDGRQIQAQGYIMLGVDGSATLLRAGAGAVRLNLSGGPRIAAFDYDRAGGAVISGIAPAGVPLQVRGGSELLGEGRADEAGHFSIPIVRPLSPGSHRLQVTGEAVSASATVDISPPADLTDGPFRASRGPGGLRADWLTPGGGVQTTLLLD